MKARQKAKNYKKELTALKRVLKFRQVTTITLLNENADLKQQYNLELICCHLNMIHTYHCFQVLLTV